MSSTRKCWVNRVLLCCDTAVTRSTTTTPTPRRPRRTHRLGGRLLGLVRPRPRTGIEQPQKLSPNIVTATDLPVTPGVDEVTMNTPQRQPDRRRQLPARRADRRRLLRPFAGSDELREDTYVPARPPPAITLHPTRPAIDMVERAAQGLIEGHGRDTIENVDILITHTQLPDRPVLRRGRRDRPPVGMQSTSAWIFTTGDVRRSCRASTSPADCWRPGKAGPR